MFQRCIALVKELNRVHYYSILRVLGCDQRGPHEGVSRVPQ